LEGNDLAAGGHEMSIQEWAALAEIVGAIAVVASLAYLAVQIRQNTRELVMSIKSIELAAFERNVESGNRIREMFILNPEISELFSRGRKSYVDLEEIDKLRFGMILSNVFSAMQGGYVRQLTFGSDPENFSGSARMLDGLIRARGVRDWLSSNNPDWRPEFAALVQQRLQLFVETTGQAVKEAQKHGAPQTDE
jgi:hypothetical protein